ncbi:ABC transporter ATP-binding protein [Lactobacillus crispatus]|uniref:ATP-binding cassette domain-containing protein n=1 Tax=Lactobacillus crispatus TaxID=47770 RepID=A0A7H9EBH3_9LACO|nr:ABC transporter ATP-binding protein [Lactobacillus crispatus]MBW0437361.1 ABC transporter ATP-binding protein [Lactobacillus crispatus]MBW0444308.1 ABC transporter ATP-binding protein [Lactobacillus crispatus]MBW0456057.1 ABC transporter ATP-binding protein [Lactobacillus crispatus]QLL74565.1 ATP-binding cassette domain-containing protein [Lactobacillus crispatus]
MKLFQYFQRLKFEFLFVIFLIVVNAGFLTLAGISSANALSAVAKLKADRFFMWVALMGSAYIFYAIVNCLVNVEQTRLSQNVDKLIRNDIAKDLSRTSYSGFHKQTVATYSSWLTNDITTINNFGVADFMMIIRQISEIVFGMLTLAYFNISLVVTVIILTVIMGVVPNLFSRGLSKRSLEYTKANERLVNSINDVLNGFNTLFLTNLPQTIVKKINGSSDDVKKHALNYSKTAGITQAITNGLAFISQVIILGQTGWLILHNLTPVGTISGAQFFASTIFAELSGISFNWQEFKSVKPIMEKFKTVPPNAVSTALPNDFKLGNVKLDELSYQYSGQDKPILKNFNLDFKLKNKYILVGDSAAGKSTLLNLISGLLRDYQGKIDISNLEYRHISDYDLHKQISYLQQDPYIFTASLKWNLTLGRKIPEARINEVIESCGLTDLITKLPDRIDTVLSDQGKQLSGGQKQRIAFARALLRDTPIYLLDEATSALDKTSSMQLEQLILTKQDKTVIMVTHHLRDEIKQLADQVIDLNKLKEM